MERVSQFYLFVVGSVIFNSHTIFLTIIKKNCGAFKNEHQFPTSYFSGWGNSIVNGKFMGNI